MTPQFQVVSAAKKATVLLVDDHPIMRQGLTQLINQEPDLAVCGHAADANSAFHAIAAYRPDIVILDISLDGPDGLSVLKEVRANDWSLPVLVLSMHDESLYAERATLRGQWLHYEARGHGAGIGSDPPHPRRRSLRK